MNHLATVLLLLFFWSSLKAAPLLRRDGVDNFLDATVAEDRDDIINDKVTVDLDQDKDEMIPYLNDEKEYNEEQSDTTSSSGIFQSILSHVMKGHVTADSLSRWMSQINSAMSKGTLSSESVSRFIAILKERLAGTAVGENCCPLG